MSRSFRSTYNRQGTTLMEVLLVIGVLAVVAAVAAPQFFRSGSQATDEARMQQMKTNYSTVKAAILAHLQRENILKAEVHLLDGGAVDGTVSDTDSRIGRLVTAGSLQLNGTFIENSRGQQLPLMVQFDSTTTSGDELLPKINLARKQLHVVVKGTSGTTTNVDIDLRLAANKTFEEIWSEVKALVP